MKKDEIKLKQDKVELILIAILSAIIAVGFVFPLTPLIKIKFVEMLVNLIILNTWNFLIIIAILTILYHIKKKMLKDQIIALTMSEERDEK